MTPALAAYLRDLTTRCEQATTGPWKVSNQDDYLVISREGRIATTDFLADASLIAAARTDLPTLVRLVRDFHAAGQGMRGALRPIFDYADLTEQRRAEVKMAMDAYDEALARAEALITEGNPPAKPESPLTMETSEGWKGSDG